jgi:hypothetical protein
MMASGKRGRPRTIRPFFDDPESERLRVDQCIKEGRDPYPKLKFEPCAAELSLRADVEPYIPFELVLALNDSDEDGYPICSPEAERRWVEAKAKQKEAAQRGGELRETDNYAKQVISAEASYILDKRAQGRSISWVIKEINAKLSKRSEKCVGRSEMYKQLAASGLWR